MCVSAIAAGPTPSGATSSGVTMTPPSQVSDRRRLLGRQLRQRGVLLGEVPAPTPGAVHLARLEPVVLAHEEALLPGDQVDAMAAELPADALGRPAGQGGRARQAGVEGGG